MITIKLPVEINVTSILRDFNSCVRFAYNRSVEGFKTLEIKLKTSLGCWLAGCAIIEGQTWHKKSPDRRIVFGGKQNLKLRSEGKISKEEWRARRLHPLLSVGEKSYKGNRHFQLDVIENNRIIFKPRRGERFYLALPRLSRRRFQQLALLELESKNRKIPITYRLDNSRICISFDEKILSQEKVELRKNRVFAIDLNPNNIGYSVLEFDKKDDFKIVSKGLVDLKCLNVKSGFMSSDPRSKKLTNKRHFELFEVSKRLTELAKQFQCSKFVIEDLNMPAKDCKLGREINRLVNNVWNRGLLVQSLRKRSSIYGIEFVEANPAYSSIVGNLLYANRTTPDAIAASIEIGRRGFKKFSKNWFYPKLIANEVLQNRRKKDVELKFENWRELFRELKNSRVKYRVSFEDTIFSRVFKFKSSNSRVLLYEFGR